MVDLNKADEYIERARIDSLAIQILLPHLDSVPETICDMCQQCAEKMLKQMFLDHGSFPPRSHDLVELVRQASEHGWMDTLEEDLAPIIFLNSYGVKSRYLTLSESERAEAVEAVASLRSVSDMLSRNNAQHIQLDTDIAYLHSSVKRDDYEVSVEGLSCIESIATGGVHTDHNPSL